LHRLQETISCQPRRSFVNFVNFVVILAFVVVVTFVVILAFVVVVVFVSGCGRCWPSSSLRALQRGAQARRDVLWRTAAIEREASAGKRPQQGRLFDRDGHITAGASFRSSKMATLCFF
jgi:uncharacterized membrane protein